MLDWVVVGLDVEWGLGPALSTVSCGRKGLCLAHIVPSNFVYSRCSINAACLHEYKIEQSDYPDVFSLLIFSKSKSSFSPISFPNMLVMVNMDLYSLNTPIPHNSSHREILQVFYKWSPVSQVPLELRVDSPLPDSGNPSGRWSFPSKKMRLMLPGERNDARQAKPNQI